MKIVKSTRSLAALELEAIRKATKLNLKSLALAMGIKYRTLQDYVGGQRPVPSKVLEKARAEQIRQRELMQRIVREVNHEIDQRYPLGIPSEVEA